ncbi:MAG: bifunctional 5,10-methylenetetrahydrofolate dehydrogenase/5,10-methenyltetrahydrofolate cyclohydrolase, partial [bacterium]|nr:bifunctional 5,10-methylenetetrahydrofolate dehydrogenase/5,10-methenyltetrahydrofolate cyclohydrolase [bacterium]
MHRPTHEEAGDSVTETATLRSPLLDGKAVAHDREEALRIRIEARVAAGLVRPGLAVVLVGDDPASHVYVRNKERGCGRVGLESRTVRMPATCTTAEIVKAVETLNADPTIHGILVQMPLPAGCDPLAVQLAIDPDKDVDGLHPLNAGRLASGLPGLVPATPRGVMTLLSHAGISLRGAQAVVIGRSNLVGKPVAQLLLQADATVTVCHSRTRDLAHQVRQADVVVAAVGIPGLVTADMVKPGAVVIDVGINRNAEGKLVGDV